MKTVGNPTVFSIICGFLGVLSFSGVPSTPTFAQNAFYIKICSLRGRGHFCVEQKPHDKNYKVYLKSKFNIFEVENRREPDGFLNYMRLFRRFKLLWRTQYADVRSKRLLHQNLLAPWSRSLLRRTKAAR